MFWIYTMFYSTEMIKFQPHRDRTNDYFIDYPVS